MPVGVCASISNIAEHVLCKKPGASALTAKTIEKGLEDMNRIVIGCVGDDFTGSSDAASFIAQEGIKTLLFNGTPKQALPDFSEDIACVIALKTRTEKTGKAVAQTLEAFKWLCENGAERYFIKYCSTFDSTPKGNIGPIVDAVLETYGFRYTILCPALPVNGRTVVNGHLYVNGVPLHQTHMKDHPLTPMWDSDIVKLMQPQGKYPCLVLDADALEKGEEEIANLLLEFGKGKEHFYVVPDYSLTEHAQRIVDVFGDLPLLTGGSGLMTQLSQRSLQHKAGDSSKLNGSQGKALVLAGSCSKATLEQIEDFRQRGGSSVKIDPMALLDGSQTISLLKEAMSSQTQDAFLLYSSDSPENVREAQRAGVQAVSELLENTMAELATYAVQNGYSRIIVAGGETSGAVTKALGHDAYLVGASIAPGVPIMVPMADTGIRLVLKSGNFGQRDFFTRAIDMTGDSNL